MANATNTSSPIAVSQGGLGASSLTSNSVLIGNGVGNIAEVAAGSANSIFVGTGGAPQFSTTGTIYFTAIRLSGGTNLNVYSEGTFTPTITNTGAAPTVTYAAQVGRYTKIGERVLINIYLALSAYTPGTGSVNITGYPFTNVSGEVKGCAGLQNITFPQLTYAQTSMQSSANRCFLQFYRSAGTPVNLGASAPSATAIFNITTEYEAN